MNVKTTFWAAILAILPALAFAQSPAAAPPALDPAAVRDLQLLPVQHAGRIKPLDSLAREMVQFVTGKRRYRGQEPIVTYLSWTFESEKWTDEPMVRVEYLPLRQKVG